MARVVSAWRVELGAAIREARVAVGLSQERLANELGVRQSSVSQWEQGTTAPATWHLLGLLQVLGMLLVWLVLGEGAGGQGGDMGLAEFCRSFGASAAEGEGPVASLDGRKASLGVRHCP